MYPRIPCERVADPLVSVEHTSGTTGLGYLAITSRDVRYTVNLIRRLYIRVYSRNEVELTVLNRGFFL